MLYCAIEVAVSLAISNQCLLKSENSLLQTFVQIDNFMLTISQVFQGYRSCCQVVFGHQFLVYS